MRVYNGHMVHTKGNDLKAWRHNIGYCAKAARVPLLEGAEAIELRFVFLRPKTVKRVDMTVYPDLDKLVRNCLDALSGIAYRDDSQVCSILATKVYGENQGVEISVGLLTQV